MEKNISFKVGKPSYEEMSREKANEYAKSQGMRLPTRIESLIMVENKDKLGFELPEWWWTCEEHSATAAWYVDGGGGVDNGNKYVGGGAVPVAAFDSNLKTDSLQSESDALTAEQMVANLRKMGYDVKCSKTITVEL